MLKSLLCFSEDMLNFGAELRSIPGNAPNWRIASLGGGHQGRKHVAEPHVSCHCSIISKPCSKQSLKEVVHSCMLYVCFDFAFPAELQQRFGLEHLDCTSGATPTQVIVLFHCPAFCPELQLSVHAHHTAFAIMTWVGLPCPPCQSLLC